MILKVIIVVFMFGSFAVYGSYYNRDRLGYISQSNNIYQVGMFSVSNNTFTCWSNVFVTTEQLPQTGPYSPVEYIFENGEIPKTFVSNDNGMEFISFPPKYFHIYGRTNLYIEVVDPPMKCSLNRQGDLLFGFSETRRFFVIDKIKHPNLKSTPTEKRRWEERNINIPTHRTNDLEALKQKYIKDYGKKNK
jgi:hypothetical protein